MLVLSSQIYVKVRPLTCSFITLSGKLISRVKGSSSAARVSDEFLINLSPAGKGSPSLKPSAADQDLPLYTPVPEGTKKEGGLHQKSSGENAIHLIPVILVLCALVLWLFSHPSTTTTAAERLNS
nr:PREDICTED: uncharacterized protein LOC108212108 [Daucus carota subsp. sativus]